MQSYVTVKDDYHFATALLAFFRDRTSARASCGFGVHSLFLERDIPSASGTHLSSRRFKGAFLFKERPPFLAIATCRMVKAHKSPVHLSSPADRVHPEENKSLTRTITSLSNSKEHQTPPPPSSFIRPSTPLLVPGLQPTPDPMAREPPLDVGVEPQTNASLRSVKTKTGLEYFHST